ncbi:hypothetical protein GW756_02135 [bacterium]|nr:hypothetical protein [bacterium]NCQ55592.1 hypothetical protein [Candidatus Parcubacteria bacterium]NCS67417.1 hypothetical protein [Candidatus Peregrinibacteria bacterium]NCS96143.1 hypothetical protein [bacterium]
MDALPNYPLDNQGVSSAVRDVLRFLMVDVDKYTDQDLLTFWESTSAEEKLVITLANTRQQIMELLSDEKSTDGNFDEQLVGRFRNAFSRVVLDSKNL